MGTSLVVQWLPPCATVAADTGYIGGQGTKILNAVGTAKKKTHQTNMRAHTPTHPQNTNYIFKQRLGFLVAQVIKNLPVMQDTWVLSLGWKIPGEGNGNPHQYSCLENPMDRGFWEAIVHGVAQSLDMTE